ncbi:hypothetical protein KSC_009600 [Ktedonobacter sp. SOSP1-52]|uniref:hypothetical protein n=1 Tax=Ktedonobacter sp. SOSP1-52 TaxID=2778366 RepID=UPI001915AC8C|nr:hypothetical protein [Ktedonobacter sp. SOSP1-52]GHO62068.1 hypothetical protein KSC_009600 [Ktedonobacter sp. SOSP1-52]
MNDDAPTEKLPNLPSLPQEMEMGFNGSEPVTPTSPTLPGHWPLPGSIIRNALNTQTNNVEVSDAQFEHKTPVSPDNLVATTDIFIPMPPPPPIHVPGDKRTGKKALYSLFILGLVTGLLLGSIGMAFFIQRVQNTPPYANQPTSGPTKGVTPVVTSTPTPVIHYNYSFEDGQNDGWEPQVSPGLKIENSTKMAKNGAHSLLITFNNKAKSTYPHLSAAISTNAPHAYQTVYAYVYVASGKNVQGKIYMLDHNFKGYYPGIYLSYLTTGTWHRLSYILPSGFQGTATRIGLEFTGTNAIVYIDAIYWK